VRALVLLGPNLGALGRRDPERYGSETLQDVRAALLNPGALAHYSHALRDAVEASGLAVIEVHQTNIYAREGFRSPSVVSPACRALVVGLGTRGYHLGLEALAWITG